jgi:hypothetical protein
VRRFAAALVPLLIIGSSCTEPTGPKTEASGSVQFSHDAGAFSASGVYSSNSSNDTKRQTTWAMGFLRADQTTVVEAHIARSDGLADQILLVLDRRAAGTTTISSACTPTVVHTCPQLDVLFGTTGDFFNDPAVTQCELTDGDAEITTLTADRAVGTFSGDGTCQSPSGNTPWHIQNGTFDVGLVTEP